MSALTRLSSKLPGDPETNGLDSLHEKIISDPEQVTCALVWIDYPKITIDTETGEKVVTARLRKVEPIGSADKVPAAVIELYQQVQTERLGRVLLPFADVDPRGEVVHTTTSTPVRDGDDDAAAFMRGGP